VSRREILKVMSCCLLCEFYLSRKSVCVRGRMDKLVALSDWCSNFTFADAFRKILVEER
jgi:hypothetical protein